MILNTDLELGLSWAICTFLGPISGHVWLGRSRKWDRNWSKPYWQAQKVTVTCQDWATLLSCRTVPYTMSPCQCHDAYWNFWQFWQFLTLPDASLTFLMLPQATSSFLTLPEASLRFLMLHKASWLFLIFHISLWCYVTLCQASWQFHILKLLDHSWDFLTFPDYSLYFPILHGSSWDFLMLPEASWSFLLLVYSPLHLLTILVLISVPECHNIKIILNRQTKYFGSETYIKLQNSIWPSFTAKIICNAKVVAFKYVFLTKMK